MHTLIATRPRRALLYASVLVVCVAAGTLARAALSAGPGATGPLAPAALTALTHHRLGRFDSVVARARGTRVALYRHPGGRPYRHIGSLAHSYGTPLVLLVRGRRGGWLHVSLPVRPNHSSAWVKASAVRESVTHYRVKVELRRHRLTVWKGTHRILRVPIGVGHSVTPTPGGTYFLAYLLRTPNPHGSYGPYAFGLSAYSNVLSSFAGGDGEIGLHGTDNPAAIGSNVSHGCIRVTNRVIAHLAKMLPLGTPLVVAR